MADALTAPFAVAAIVLCAAGFAKLRTPDPAVSALAAAGLGLTPALVQALAAGEILLGAWSVVLPGRLSALLLACVYAAFCGLSAVLVRLRVACGCFGKRHAPASNVHLLISGALGLVALAAGLRVPHGAMWIAGRPLVSAVVLEAAIAASAYATVLVYAELPAIWSAWSAR